MPERIYKLQPDRTLALRGFDSFAAAASIHSASPTGFTVSGTFRDPADFCVAVLYDADNFYEHPSLKYLPDFDFSGLTLNFDVQYSDGVQPIDSPKFDWIDWAKLDCILEDNTPAEIRLWDNATLKSTTFPAATGSLTVQTAEAGIQPYDRLTLWFQNLAYDYIVPSGSSTLELKFFAVNTGTTHSIDVDGRTYFHNESGSAGEPSAAIAAALIAAISAGSGDPDIVASTGASSNGIVLTLRSTVLGRQVSVSASDGNGPGTLFQITRELIAASLTSEINATDWHTAATTQAVMASNSGPTITFTAARYGKVNVSGNSVTFASGTRFAGITAGSTIFLGDAPYTVASTDSPTSLTLTTAATSGTNVAYVAPRGGRDGNEITLFARARTSTLTAGQSSLQLSGGSSDVTWTCSIDFTAHHIDQIRQCWLTFAPSLTNGAVYTSTEWNASFSNWRTSGDEAKRMLQVAGAGSIRIEETDSACTYNGTWTTESGFYSRYFATAARAIDASVTVTYTCGFPHNLYLGTSLYSDRANAAIQVDGDTETEVVCLLSTGSAINTRRLARTRVAAGRHTVRIRQKTVGILYFDFLEAAVLSDIPAPLAARQHVSPALDFDTDHTYKLSPARLHWIFDQLGYAGPMNEYLGVFWWNERKLVGGSYSTSQIQFTGTWAEGDTVFINLNGTSLGKTTFATDDPTTIAAHFAAIVNQTFGGAWASATGDTLLVQGRSPAPAYNLSLTIQVNSTTGGAMITQTPIAGQYGTWLIDDTVTNPLNKATRDWHSDFYALCATRSRDITTACSMELVLPPDGYVARYPDTAHTAVSTATGFGSLSSNHCAIGSSKMIAYQKSAYRAIAQLQQAAGLIPSIQFGEFLWWFFAGPSGMAYYDDETMAAAQTALGRPLHVFLAPNDVPTVNTSTDALFLRNRLRDHVAALVSDLRSAYPTIRCEVLWPGDVNHQTPEPEVIQGIVYYLGGQLNRFINLPTEWQTKATSGLDAVKVEALAFGATMRNLDLAKEAIQMFPGFGWPVDSVRYLVPVFGIATPWHREVALAKAAGLQTINLWAFDHICLYNLDVPEKALERRSVVQTT